MHMPTEQRRPQTQRSVRSGWLGFNGERLEPGTGHYLLGSGYRAYNPMLMRFNNPDELSPFGRGGLNAYAYCLGDPVNLVDPDGHVPLIRMFAQLRKLFGSAAGRFNRPKGMKRLHNSSSSSIGSGSVTPPSPPPPLPPRKPLVDALPPTPPLPPRKPVAGSSHDASSPPPLLPRKPVINDPHKSTLMKQQVGNTAVPHAMEDASQLNLAETRQWLSSRPQRELIHSDALIVIGQRIVPAGSTRTGANARRQANLRDGVRRD